MVDPPGDQRKERQKGQAEERGEESEEGQGSQLGLRLHVTDPALQLVEHLCRLAGGMCLTRRDISAAITTKNEKPLREKQAARPQAAARGRRQRADPRQVELDRIEGDGVGQVLLVRRATG